MRHLTLQRSHTPHPQDPTTSATFDAFASHRTSIPITFLRKVLRDGWLTDAQEHDALGHSLLLVYLGTFANPNTGNPPNPTLVANSNNLEMLVSGTLDDVDVAIELLDRGANPWAKDLEGRDVLDQTVSLLWWPLLDRLLADPGCPSSADLMQRTQYVEHLPGSELPWLHAAMALGRTHLAERWLDQGFDINQCDDHGRTALFYALNSDGAKLLLDRGIDVTVQDHAGRHAGLHWSTPNPYVRALPSEQLTAMGSLLQPVLKQQLADNPEKMRALQASVLFEHAIGNTKDNLVKHMRANRFTGNEQHTVDGHTLSLFAEANLAIVRDHGRNNAIALHLLNKLDDTWFESIPGVPDVVLGWFTSAADSKPDNAYQRAVQQRLSERYGWDQPEGFVRFLDEVLPMAQRLIEHEQPRTAEQLAVNAMANTVAKMLQRLRDAKHLLPEAARGWGLQRNEQGYGYPWLFASVVGEGAMGAMPVQQAKNVDEMLYQWVCGGTRSGWDGDPRYVEALIPVDSMALHAMLVPLGYTAQSGVPRDHYANNALESVFVRALHKGVRLDSSLPGFDDRMARIQRERPGIARDLENRLLNEEAKKIPVVQQAPRVRTRL